MKNRKGRPNKSFKLKHGIPDPVFTEPTFCGECGAQLIHAPLNNNNDELVCPVCGLVNRDEEEKEDE